MLFDRPEELKLGNLYHKLLLGLIELPEDIAGVDFLNVQEGLDSLVGDSGVDELVDAIRQNTHGEGKEVKESNDCENVGGFKRFWVCHLVVSVIYIAGKEKKEQQVTNATPIDII